MAKEDYMFFSVKNPIKIGGKLYKPCICYELTAHLELTIEKLAKEDKVSIYESKVFFCNGKLVKAEEKKTEKKTEKKSRKNKAPVTKEAEEVPAEAPAEDNKNIEDF